MHSPAVAQQQIPSTDPAGEPVVVLAPTAECQKKEGTLVVSIKYVVDITCRVFGAEDMMVSLPVTLMSPQSDWCVRDPWSSVRCLSSAPELVV